MNTIENKEKLFSQYWGQKVATVINPFSKELIKDCRVDARVTDIMQYLRLKPLSSISDEDAMKIAAFIDTYNRYEIELIDIGKEMCSDLEEGINNIYVGSSPQFITIIDYLRSKSYALPYLGISVEDQVKFGWIKLEE